MTKSVLDVYATTSRTRTQFTPSAQYQLRAYSHLHYELFFNILAACIVTCKRFSHQMHVRGALAFFHCAEPTSMIANSTARAPRPSAFAPTFPRLW
jgi:hypothetical protein